MALEEDVRKLSEVRLQSRGRGVPDGASTAHLACHIGILQRGTLKLDRESRD